MTQENTSREADYKKLNITNEVKVSHKDLPLHCPINVGALWCSHPKVFIPLGVTEATGAETKSARCPYCGTLYTLID